MPEEQQSEELNFAKNYKDGEKEKVEKEVGKLEVIDIYKTLKRKQNLINELNRTPAKIPSEDTFFRNILDNLLARNPSMKEALKENDPKAKKELQEGKHRIGNKDWRTKVKETTKNNTHQK